jgi:hypothetical protein
MPESKWITLSPAILITICLAKGGQRFFAHRISNAWIVNGGLHLVAFAIIKTYLLADM